MIRGDVHPRWQRLADAFERVLDHDAAGASVAIVHDGELVVDLWGGADPLTGRPWDADSVTIAFSAAKGITALLVAMQIQAGHLDPDAPVTRYWPEFGAAGKESITVRDVLTHVAGVPVLPIDTVADLLDARALAERLAPEPPAYAPRSARIYHVLSYGTILGELLRRVTGEDIGTLLRSHVGEPLDAALWFGSPADVDARFRPGLMGPVESPPPPPDDGPDAAALGAGYRSTEQIIPLFERVDAVPGTEAMNSVAFRRAQLAGGGLVADARSLARVYGACVAPVGGVRLLSDETVSLVSRDHLGGVREPVYLPGAIPASTWGLGFEIAHPACPMLGPGSFGHAGMGGRLAFAHAPSRLGFAFVGQQMEFPPPGTDERWAVLLSAVEATLGSSTRS